MSLSPSPNKFKLCFLLLMNILCSYSFFVFSASRLQFLSLFSSHLHFTTFPLAQNHSPPFLFRKEQTSQEDPLNMAVQDWIRLGTNSHTKAGQGHPVRGKGSQKQAKEPEAPVLPLENHIKLTTVIEALVCFSK